MGAIAKLERGRAWQVFEIGSRDLRVMSMC